MTTRHQRQAIAAATEALLEQPAAPPRPRRPGSRRADMAAQDLINARRIIRMPGWRLFQTAQDGQRWIHPTRRLSLIWSVEEHDGRLWLHVSIASPDRLPRWDELKAAKEWIAGTERYAYQVIPPRSRHVNIHANALHVYSPLDGDPPLPDFTAGGDSI